MSAPTQDKKDAPGSEPGKDAPKDDRAVPLGEFIELRQQLKAVSEELAKLKSGPVAPKQPETAPAPSQPPSETEQIGKKLQEIERRERIRDLVSELGLGDQKQGQIVLDILSKNPDLAPPEALALASKRSPDIFKEQAGGGFDPKIHGSLRPTPGAQPPEPKQSDFKRRMDHAKKLMASGHKHAAERIAGDLIGMKAAEALGWDYKPIEIPNQ